MDMWSSSKIVVDRIRVSPNLVLKLLESSEGGFATYRSEVFLLKEGILVIDST